MVAYALDEALAAVEQIADRHAAEQPRRAETLRPDERYADESDYDEDLPDAA